MVGVEPTLTVYQTAVQTSYTTRPYLVAGERFERSNTSFLKTFLIVPRIASSATILEPLSSMFNFGSYFARSYEARGIVKLSDPASIWRWVKDLNLRWQATPDFRQVMIRFQFHPASSFAPIAVWRIKPDSANPARYLVVGARFELAMFPM